MKSWEGPNGETAGYLIDGGKNIAFSQSAVEIKKLFTSNREHEIGIYKFSQEKKKNITGGTEYLVKVKEGGKEEGAAVVKIWGPNNKRETKIGLNKSAKSEAKFVDTLATKT